MSAETGKSTRDLQDASLDLHQDSSPPAPIVNFHISNPGLQISIEQWMQKILRGAMCPQEARVPISPNLQMVGTEHTPSSLRSSWDRHTYNPLDTESKLPKSTESLTSTSATPRSPVPRGPRTRGKIVAKATTLGAVDDSAGPLGPLGESSSLPEQDQPPVPPSKEQSLPVRHERQPQQSPMSRSLVDSNDAAGDDRSSIGSRQRYPQQGQNLPGIENAKRNPHPSVSIEQAARPTFDITVGDPHKVGDLTSSHIVYQVRTKV